MDVIAMLALATFFSLIFGTVLAIICGLTALEIFFVWVGVIMIVICCYHIAHLILFLTDGL